MEQQALLLFYRLLGALTPYGLLRGTQSRSQDSWNIATLCDDIIGIQFNRSVSSSDEVAKSWQITGIDTEHVKHEIIFRVLKTTNEIQYRIPGIGLWMTIATK